MRSCISLDVLEYVFYGSRDYPSLGSISAPFHGVCLARPSLPISNNGCIVALCRIIPLFPSIVKVQCPLASSQLLILHSYQLCACPHLKRRVYSCSCRRVVNVFLRGPWTKYVVERKLVSCRHLETQLSVKKKYCVRALDTL